LLGAGWEVYRRLPVDHENAALFEEASDPARETKLEIVLRRIPDNNEQLSIPIEIFSVDVASLQRELPAGKQTTEQLDAYLKRRMGQPVKAQLDERGQTTVKLRQGQWWIHARLSGTRELTWQLPINVAGRSQTVELTAENAYTRTKTF
jgi:hypothetical protein